MEIRIVVKKVHIFILMAFILLVGFAVAWNTNNPSAFGHTSGEIQLPSGQTLSAWSSTVCDSSGNNCPSGRVVGGGNRGLSNPPGTGIASCGAWGVATCASTYGDINCPSGTTKRWSGSEMLYFPGPPVQLLPITVYLCIKN